MCLAASARLEAAIGRRYSALFSLLERSGWSRLSGLHWILHFLSSRAKREGAARTEREVEGPRVSLQANVAAKHFHDELSLLRVSGFEQQGWRSHPPASNIAYLIEVRMEISWQENVDSALAEAKKQDRLVLIDVSAAPH